MVRIIIELDTLNETPDPEDEAQVTLLQEHMLSIAERIQTERLGILEDYDGAPCGSFRVEVE